MKSGNINSNSNNIPKSNIQGVFDVPKDYFSGFENKILQKIELENELQEYKALASIPKLNPFDVPGDYFNVSLERLNNLRLSCVRERSIFIRLQEILFKPRLSFSFVLLLVVGLSFYYYFSENNKMKNTCETLACIDRNEIINYALDANIEQHQIEEWVSTDSLYIDVKKVPSDAIIDDELTIELNTNDLTEEL